MVDFRRIVDLSPWDKTGQSWMGLRKTTTKKIGGALIFLGIFLSTPPGLIPDDWLNIGVANFLKMQFDIPTTTGLLYSYTLIAWSTILLGIWIYPYNSTSLINGYMHKLKVYIKRLLSNPKHLIILIVAGILMMKFYDLFLIK